MSSRDTTGKGLRLVDPPRQVGEYELHFFIDRGNTGEVYLAERKGTLERYAIKLARLDKPHAAALIRAEGKKLRKLRCDGIVEVCAVGNVAVARDDGSTAEQPFIAMEFMGGGNLAERADDFKEARASLRLFLLVVNAVQRAHDRSFMHCDIKPENILFKRADSIEPKVADFGLGRGIGRQREPNEPNEPNGGTIGWMSPEQATGGELTVASDIFSLGVLLHWLVTGSEPFGTGPGFEAYRRRLLEEEPPPATPRGRAGDLDWEVAAICRRAMAKAVDQRYASARELAADVTRALEGQPLSQESGARRTAKWVRRNWMGLGVSLLAFMALLPLFQCAKSREGQVNAAFHQAIGTLSEVGSFADRIELMATDPEVKSLVHHPDLQALPRALERYAFGGVSNLFVLSPDGAMLARWPRVDKPPLSRDFSFRDYFRGATAPGAAKTYIGRAIFGKLTERPELEIAAPMFDGEVLIGVVVGARMAHSTFGRISMDCRSGECSTAVYASHDREQPLEPFPFELTVLAARDLQEGEWRRVPPLLSREICQTVQSCVPAPDRQLEELGRVEPGLIAYENPLDGRCTVGAFAPVGRTGLTIGVERECSVADRVLGFIHPLSPLQLSLAILVLTVGMFSAILKFPIGRPAKAAAGGQPARPLARRA